MICLLWVCLMQLWCSVRRCVKWTPAQTQNPSLTREGLTSAARYFWWRSTSNIQMHSNIKCMISRLLSGVRAVTAALQRLLRHSSASLDNTNRFAFVTNCVSKWSVISGKHIVGVSWTSEACFQSLDPYDGSSEDSGSSAEGSKKQRLGGFRAKGTGRRSAPGEMRARSGAADVQMRSSSDSEQETPDQGLCSPCKSLMCVKADLSDSGFNTRSSLNSPAVPSARDTPSPDSPALHAAFSKRKFFPPPGDADDGMQRKRQCISDMEVESVAFWGQDELTAHGHQIHRTCGLWRVFLFSRLEIETL